MNKALPLLLLAGGAALFLTKGKRDKEDKGASQEELPKPEILEYRGWQFELAPYMEGDVLLWGVGARQLGSTDLYHAVGESTSRDDAIRMAKAYIDSQIT